MYGAIANFSEAEGNEVIITEEEEDVQPSTSPWTRSFRPLKKLKNIA